MTTEVILLTKGKKPQYFKYEYLKPLENILRGRTADVVVAFGPVNDDLIRTFRYIVMMSNGKVILMNGE